MDELVRVKILLFILVPVLSVASFVSFFLYCRLRRRRRDAARALPPECGRGEVAYDAGTTAVGGCGVACSLEAEQLIRFAGGEDLTIGDILEAPGEVVGRSGYETVYRATLRRGGAVVLLRFLRPACAAGAAELLPAARALGSLRHPNLVPLRALYVGPRGEKLFVHPFFPAGTVARLLRYGIAESQRWEITWKIAVGVARGLHHLHAARPRPIVHGNLRSSIVLLDADLQPRLADFGLHLLLTPAACQELLEAAAAKGYKAPELIKMKEATRESDIYSFGVLLVELLIQEEQGKGTMAGLATLLHVREQPASAALHKLAGGGEGMLKLARLAMQCCSPSPVLRPDAKTVLWQLEELGGGQFT